MKAIQEVCKKRSVVVIPAFMTAVQWQAQEDALALASLAASAETKQDLRQLVLKGLVYQFHVTHFRWVRPTK